MQIDPRTHYSGTPEPDRFKHERPGEALLVSLAGPSAMPEVTPLATASFSWSTLELHLLEGDDPVSAMEAVLPTGRDRRHCLSRIVASGQSHLDGHARLVQAVESVAPDFAFLELDDVDLAIQCEIADLDLIDRVGALREAANALLAEASDESRSAADRDIARAALARLYSLAQGATA
jgi:hypothetical protein